MRGQQYAGSAHPSLRARRSAPRKRPSSCTAHRMSQEAKRFVYVILHERIHSPYVGVTSNVAGRLHTHNSS